MPTASISLAIAPFGEEESAQRVAVSPWGSRSGWLVVSKLVSLERVVVLSDIGNRAPRAAGGSRRAGLGCAGGGRFGGGGLGVRGGVPRIAASRDLEISVEVRSGHSGAPLSRHHASVAAAIDEALIDEALIDEKDRGSLAAGILQALGYDAAAAATADVAAAPPPGPAGVAGRDPREAGQGGRATLDHLR